MIIRISADLVPALDDAANFRRFHVELAVPPAALPRLRSGLAGLADWTDATEAWISIAALQALPEAPADPAWREGLEAMIEKARPHGWVRATPVPAIKAHLVWQS